MNQNISEHFKSLTLAPDDEHNRSLADNVHPSEWTNPTPKPIYDAVIIGAGTTGLVAASGVAGLGGNVALIERNLMGGDCLNVGCVPSKALIRSARAAAALKNTSEFGIELNEPGQVDFPKVMERLRGLRSRISPNDSAERFSSKGVDIFFGDAKFSARDCITVDGIELKFRKAVIAAGASAFVPPIEGIDQVEYLTNETLFNLTELPETIVIVGGGPIGCEMAQSFARLGSHVILVEMGDRIMPRDDRQASELMMDVFKREGVDLRTGTSLIRLEHTDGSSFACFKNEAGESKVKFDAVLIAVGRKKNVDGLDLEHAGVDSDPRKGIIIDDHFRTSNPKIFAAGDIASRFQFTHAADAMARSVIVNAFFFGRARHSKLIIPWTTYTSPEVAGVGLSKEAAEEQDIPAEEITISFADVDRAILDGEDEGFLKVVYGRKGKILSATIVAQHAGDMIGEVVLAMQHGITLGKIASVIHPYPTQGEALKRAGDEYRRTLLKPGTAKILKWLLKRGR